MRPGNSERARATGFTLIELLVTMTVLSLLMTAAVGSVRMGQRSWEAGIARATANERLRSAVELLRHELLEAVPNASGAIEEPWLAFTGDTVSLRFVAPAPQSSERAGLLIYEFALGVVDDPASGLTLSYTPFDPGDPAHGGDRVERVELLPPVEAAFDYFGLRGDDIEPGWHTEWPSSEATLPTLVRLRFAPSENASAHPDVLLQVVTQVLQ